MLCDCEAAQQCRFSVTGSAESFKLAKEIPLPVYQLGIARYFPVIDGIRGPADDADDGQTLDELSDEHIHRQG